MTAAMAIRSLFDNIIFLSTFTSLIVAQILKMITSLFTKKEKRNFGEAIKTMIWRTGGMPSSHSAVVCSLATSTGIKEGVSSNFFIFSLVFATIVLRDSLGVRRSAGLQAKALNELGKQSAEKTGLEFHSVKEIEGHSLREVMAGVLLGILIAIIFHLL
jgi:acid phosphatase family membrane protein YuiD